MSELSDEEKRSIMEGLPKGTFALMLVFAGVFVVLWLLMYFGTLMARGPVS